MISEKYKCIFIHIPKTAGTSIEQKLGHFTVKTRGIQDHSPIRDFEPISIQFQLPENPGIMEKHPDEEVKNHPRKKHDKPLTQQEFDRYFKFSFVRNPWDRVYSWYRGVVRDGLLRKQMKLENQISFDDFIKQYEHIWPLNPQTYWLKNHRGQICMDFIGRFENLNTDFAKVCKELAISDTTLPHLLESGIVPYKEIYSATTKDFIYKKYREEINLFGYEY